MLRAAFTSALQAYPQAMHRNRAWLSRDLPSTCPHAEHRRRVRGWFTFSTRLGALSSSRRTSSPQPDREIPRFSPPSLALTLRPGCPAVPFADRVIFLMFRSSTRITSKRRAMPVDVFSAQSLRQSLSRAFSRATAILALPRRFDPRAVRASLRWRRRSRACSRAPRPGTVSVSPGGQGRADLNAPVDAHGLAGPRALDRAGDGGERDVPAAGPVPGHPERPRACGHVAGTTEPHPADLRNLDLAPVPVQAAHVPVLAALPGDPEPLVQAGLAPRRAAVGPGEEARRGPREVPQRLLLHRLAAPGEPRVVRPGGGQLPGLLQVSRRGAGVRGATRRAARSRGSRRTGRSGAVPQQRWFPARGSAGGGIGTMRTL